jgi:hypothetical protein
MRVAELVVEVDNGGNVVVVRAAVHRGAHVGTGCARPGRTARSSHPTVVLKWTATGGPEWPQGEVGRGAYLRLGQQVGTGGGRGSAGEGNGGGRERQGNIGEGWENASVPLSAGPRANKRDVRAVRTDAFQT